MGRSTQENEALKATPQQNGPTHPLVIQKRRGIETGPWSFLAGCVIFGQEIRAVATQKWSHAGILVTLTRLQSGTSLSNQGSMGPHLLNQGDSGLAL